MCYIEDVGVTTIEEFDNMIDKGTYKFKFTPLSIAREQAIKIIKLNGKFSYPIMRNTNE